MDMDVIITTTRNRSKGYSNLSVKYSLCLEIATPRRSCVLTKFGRKVCLIKVKDNK